MSVPGEPRTEADAAAQLHHREARYMLRRRFQFFHLACRRRAMTCVFERGFAWCNDSIARAARPTGIQLRLQAALGFHRPLGLARFSRRVGHLGFVAAATSRRPPVPGQFFLQFPDARGGVFQPGV